MGQALAGGHSPPSSWPHGVERNEGGLLGTPEGLGAQRRLPQGEQPVQRAWGQEEHSGGSLAGLELGGWRAGRDAAAGCGGGWGGMLWALRGVSVPGWELWRPPPRSQAHFGRTASSVSRVGRTEAGEPRGRWQPCRPSGQRGARGFWTSRAGPPAPLTVSHPLSASRSPEPRPRLRSLHPPGGTPALGLGASGEQSPRVWAELPA